MFFFNPYLGVWNSDEADLFLVFGIQTFVLYFICTLNIKLDDNEGDVVEGDDGNKIAESDFDDDDFDDFDDDADDDDMEGENIIEDKVLRHRQELPVQAQK